MQYIKQSTNIDLLGNELSKLGYTATKLILDGTSYTRFTSPNSRCWVTEDERIAYPFTNATIKKISKSKSLAYVFANESAINTPFTAEVTKATIGEININELFTQSPILIVKPNNASLSRGLTLNIVDKAGLDTALEKVLADYDTALVQEQVDGEEIRFSVVDGVVRSALLRQTPQVISDGVHTVAQLIGLENEQRTQIVVPYLAYPQLGAENIDSKWLADNSVPAQGDVVKLGRGTMIKTGASAYDIIDTVHPSYKKIVSQLANQVGARFIVIDMIIGDYTQPLQNNNYWFIEFNTAPVLKMYYSCRDGKMFDALSALIPMIDIAIHQTAANQGEA